MAERKWTPAQQNCMDARGGSLLVSAAAGSGKTSVLVERVVRRITDPHNPVDIDRMLIVTFTKAAAAEMKQRLSARLGDFIAQDPHNVRLQRQQMLLPCAPISTIDGFCTAFLREHFDKCDLPPRFSIAEETVTRSLKNEALEEALEVFYAAGEDGFLQLCDLLNGRRDDNGIKDAVLRTHTYISAQAFPLQWLEQACAVPDLPLCDTVWGKEIRRFTAEQLQFLSEIAQKAAAPFAPLPEAAKYYTRLIGDLQILHQAALFTADPANDWDACIRTLIAAVPDNLPAAKGLDAENAGRVKDIWSIVRKTIREKLLPLFCESERAATDEVAQTIPKLQALCGLVALFDARYTAKKKEKQLLDFSDLEHYTLNLLCDANTGAPTPLAKEAGARYTEILVDEYQDTNAVQDTIFRMLNTAENTCFFVGDVKQSIYGFRQAMPEIFIQKKESFASFDGKTFPAYVTLSDNFRSRKEVTDTVNFVFGQLMEKALCGMEYAGEELNPANTSYPPAPMQTEALLLDTPYTEKEMSSDILEARMIAMRINALLKDGTVTENGQSRPVKLRDICILLRARGTHASAIAAELTRLGIPCTTDSGIPFFEAQEVQNALAVLRTVDNPLRDVALAAVMLSPIGTFTADQLAAIRKSGVKAGKRPSLYGAVLATAQADDGASALKEQCTAFLAWLQRYRRLAVSLTADTLLMRVLEETGALQVAAVRGGDAATENLHTLFKLARDFDQGNFRGLSAFVRYIDRLESEKKDWTTTPLLSGGGDAVSVMTMHSSKGLEFPIVFLAHLMGSFNDEDTTKRLLLHGRVGAAVSGYDPDTMSTFRTVSQNGVVTAMKRTAAAEELRLLYVAMTRAKEKLITVFVKKNLTGRLRKLASFLPQDAQLSAPHLLSLDSLGDWLLSAFLRHPDAHVLRHIAGDPDAPTLADTSALLCHVCQPETLTDFSQETATDLQEADTADLAALKERLCYCYPRAALAAVPVKVAASALAKQEQNDAFVATRRPAFLSADGLTPAERGTALHTFMQFADYTAAAKDAAAEAARLTHAGFLTAAQADSLDHSKIDAFFRSALYKRMCAAQNLQREYAFTVPLKAGDYDDTLPPALQDERLIVQGIADCVFEENGELVIVDYKTDRVQDAAALTALYKRQLEIYREALTQTLGLPVKETVLYAFHLNKTVSV